MEEIMKIISDALENSREIDGFSDIEGEPGVIGVNLTDGTMYFIKVEPA